MNIKKIFIDIFSNWTFFVLMIGVSFIVSPILVHRLGNEQYGVWTLIGSIVGYFAVMDFGVMTALVRFISKYDSTEEYKKSSSYYSNACIFFIIIGFSIALLCVVLAFAFPKLYSVGSLPISYVIIVFILAGFELSILMGTGVFSGVLHAKQDFIWLNLINIFVLLFKNIVLVIMLLNGYQLMTVALIHLSATILRSSFRFFIIKKKHGHLVFNARDWNLKVIKSIFSYSIFSFLIALSIKVLFFTDSIVIGKLISISAVTYYAIPMTLMTYLEQIVTVGMSVLTPVISSNEAIGDDHNNKEIYIWGSRYSLMLSLPVVFVLFTNGDSFITLWMGEEYGLKSTSLLRILCFGYVFYLSQVIATELLKGISRHKFVAYVFSIEAVVNLLLSVVLITKFGFGIEGAALGTTIPLVAVNIFIVPLYVCRLLSINYFKYIITTYLPILLFTLITVVAYFYLIPYKAHSYLGLALYSASITIMYAAFSVAIVIDKKHLRLIVKKLKQSRLNRIL